MTTYPALTVRQPWAWALFNGKDVENRGAAFQNRTGPILVHAGLQLDRVGLERAGDRLPGHIGTEDPATLAQGALIGLIEIPETPHWWADCRNDGDLCSPWAERDQWHLPVANPVAFSRPIYVPGKLGVWVPRPEAQRKVHDALVEARMGGPE